MASNELIWLDGTDIHVLAGETGPSLLDLLLIMDDSSPRNVAFASTPPADIDSIAFTPNFVFGGSPPENGGVKVDTANGKVIVGATPTLKSFVIEAVVKTKPPNVKTLDPIPIRIIVHKTIQELWLTPATLTIREGSPGQRLTVLARFDDDTVGDVTRRPMITWDSSDAAKIAVDGADGTLTALTHPAAVTITARHAGRAATAQVQAERPWSTPVVVKLLPGSAGVAKATQVPNILFLAEGIKDGRTFENLARKIVQRLQTTPSLRPYDDVAKGHLNFWAAFVPSREPGTSPLYDMNPKAHDGTLFGLPTPAPVKPPPPPPPPPAGTPPPPPVPYTLANLIYQVGLPTPADAAVGAAAARVKWIARYGLDLSIRVTDDVYAKWQALHDHRLANELDNAFGLANGSRPTMHDPEAARVASFNSRRTTRADLDVFLQNLRLGTVGGPAIGAIWATKTPAGPPDPTGPGLPAGLKTGQDSSLVYVLLGGSPFSGAQGPDLIVSSLRHETPARVIEVFGTKQLEFDAYDLPSTPSLAAGSRVAHELSHAFGLDDEYGEFKDPLRIPAAKEQDITKGNVQAGSVLERSAADRRLDPAKLGAIKWLWPRIEHAGVLAGDPTPNGTNFDLKLMRGHGLGFARDNRVRLRARPLVDHPHATDRLQVVAVNGDVVTVKPLGAFTAGDWHAGSVLIRPVRGPATASDPDGPDLPLVAPIIAAHLAATSLPLDLAPPPPAVACAVDDRLVQIPANLPAGLPLGRPPYRADIVGLYDGGVRYYCGVYHPSGACLMRQQEPLTSRPTTYLLCPVCRYVLVDRIDPRLHRVIDRDYAKRYPQP